MNKRQASRLVILSTAGLGSLDFLEAGKRVIRQAKGFNLFSDFRLLDEGNLASICPSVCSKYSSFLNASTRGYGFMSWKAELAYRILSEYDGEVLYLWVDAGCELFSTPISRYKMRKYLNQLELDGYLYFSLDTPENKHTKEGLFEYFPSLSKSDSSPQAQTTFFGLSGELGMRIAKRWFEVVVSNINTVNEEDCYALDGTAVLHRHDQSVFSLALKELGLRPNIAPIRSDKSKLQMINRVKYLTQPVLACRNRTGKSVVNLV